MQDADAWEERKNEVRTPIFPSFLPEEAFQGLVQEEGIQPEGSILPDLRKQSTAFREAKTARIPGTQDKRKGIYTQQGGRQREREHEWVLTIFAQGSLAVPLLHSDQLICVQNVPKAKKRTTEKEWVEQSQSSEKDGDSSSSYLPKGRKHS